ncbi:MAG TPA: ABC transporter substrate-binding protein [Chloroflexota bacterium]|nr:ABC transporter substrate-binding protein [Chloroflexota bacterium]
MHARLTRRSALQWATLTGLTLIGLPATATRAAATRIRIAVVLDTSGSASVYGIPSLNGLQLAVAQINAKGGIQGHPLELLVSDGGTNPARVAALFHRYSQDPRVAALVGPTLSSEAVKLDPIAQAAGLPVMAINNTVPGLTAIGNYIFRIALGDAQIIPVVMQAAQARLRFRNVALLYDHVNAATVGERQVFQSMATRLGLSIVATETYATGAQDFSAQLGRIKAAKPDAILVAALAQEGVLILKQRRRAGIAAGVHIIGANGLNTPAVIAGAGAAAEGTIVGTAYNSGGTTPRNRRFIAAYTNRYHHAPDVFAAEGYDGLHILAAALHNAGATGDRHAVRAALAAIANVPVVIGSGGTFSFTAQREAKLAATVQIVRNGRFVTFS